MLSAVPATFAAACVVFLLPPLIFIGPRFQATAVSLATVAVMTVLAALALAGSGVATPVLYGGGLACLALAVRRLSGARLQLSSMSVLAGLVVLAAMALDTMVIQRQHGLLVLAPLYGGNAGDTLFHSAIGNMMLDFGRISTAADGVVHMPYHALSNLWIVAVGRTLGINAPAAYSIVVSALLLPLLFVQCVRTASVFAGRRPSVVLLYGLVFAAHLLYSIYDENFYLRSESLTFSIVIFLVATCGIFQLWRSGAATRVPAVQLWWLLAVLPLMFLATFGKVSTGFVLLAVVGYVQLRLWGLRKALLFGVVEAAVFVGAYTLAAHGAAAAMFGSARPFYFQYYVMKGNFLFLFSHFIFAWSLVFISWLALPDRSRPGIVRAMRRGVTVPAETALVITLLLLPLGFVLASSPVYYFTNMSMWLSLPVVAGLLARRAQGIRARTELRGPLAVVLAVAGFTALPALFEGIQDQLVGGAYRLAGQIVVDREVTGRPVPGALKGVLQPVMPAVSADANLLAADSRRLMARLVELRKVHGRALAVYFPPEDTRWWDDTNCGGSWLIPAYAGIPMVAALPTGKCAAQEQYGWSYYPRLDKPLKTMGEVCARARAKGFPLLYVPRREAWDAGEVVDCRGVSDG